MTDTIVLHDAGECRDIVGVWGDRSCPELQVYFHCHNCPVYAATGRDLLSREPPANYLADLAAARIFESTVDTSEQHSMITFRLGAEWFSLPTHLIVEIGNPSAAHKVPHRKNPAFFGLVNVRGNVIPLINLRQLIRASVDAVEGSRRRIIVEQDGQPWAFDVDDIEGIRRVADSELFRPPVSVEIATPAFIVTMYRAECGDVGVLDTTLVARAVQEACR